MSANWIAVASADHVAIGKAGGFMQVCHGKGGPLRRIRQGDRVAYYAPSQIMGRRDGLQSFVALGEVVSATPYQVEMREGFHPFRHDVRWDEGRAVPIHGLLEQLSFTKGRGNWGYAFRFGLLNVTQEDMALIGAAMGVMIVSKKETMSV